MSLSLAQRRVMIAMNDMELDNELSPCLLDQLWGGSRFSPDMDPTDAWELLKTYGLVDDEMGKIIDWQMYHEDRTFPVVAAKEEWMPLEPGDRLIRQSAACDPGINDCEITDLWDEHEMSNDFERFEADEARHELLSAVPDSGVYMVPDERTLWNAAWAHMWRGERGVLGEYPFTTEFIYSSRQENQNMREKTVNHIDQHNRVIVETEMTQFGSKYHTAKCEFGRIYVPLKFNQYLEEIGRPMKMLIRVKENDRKHPFTCIKVL
jgi:hypothetical protein